ncbi:MAG: UDP-4-amino-4,6-dideoxy-N-acetyl-beta-L-altrosamine transaminase [Thiotrichales bacterium]|nr:UDP-4-amino-4,6-dideoxy-N-acetyl-beta-L-altrosamine transaminase [Thiotrichales bacterium]
MIPYGRQAINQEDVAAVLAVLQSDFLTQGPQVPLFEQSVARFVGAEFAVAVNSATSALHLACLALELGEGDWLWTVPNTFVASANCGLYCGAQVDFVDIDPQTYTLCTKQLAEKLAWAESHNRLPKVVVPVHFAGQSCDMRAIHQLSQRYGFKIVEDASHAIGGRYLGEPIGNCRYSDITVFSFHPVKIITTAEGGLATTQNADLAQKMQLLRSHGISRDPQRMTQPSEGAWYYQQLALGYNYRMTELQAALGVSQMQRLEAFVQRRHLLCQAYDQLLADLPLQLPFQSPQSHSALHLYPVLLKEHDRATIFAQLRDRGIGVNVHYIPVHLQPYYQKMGFQAGDFPNAEDYYQRTISLPMYQGLTDEDQHLVVQVLRELLR